MDDNDLLTKARLQAMRIGAHSAEGREAAKRLLEAGLYRESTKEELLTVDHPFFLAGEYNWISPVMAAILDAQPDEIHDEGIVEAVEQVLKVKPEPGEQVDNVKLPDNHDLESKMRKLQNLTIKEAPRPKYTVAKIPEPDKDQKPIWDDSGEALY